MNKIHIDCNLEYAIKYENSWKVEESNTQMIIIIINEWCNFELLK